jgi:hypothetical protein
MKRIRILFLLPLLLDIGIAFPAHAGGQIESVMLEGAPIASHHFQFEDNDFRQRHTLVVGKVYTKDYGNWAVYVLSPNSVDRTSVGAGYITDPWTVPVGPMSLEFTGGLGLVTGYQSYPLPMLVGEARLVIYQSPTWDAGLASAAMPYRTRDSGKNHDGKASAGVVVTSPFLSLRYKFN